MSWVNAVRYATVINCIYSTFAPIFLSASQGEFFV